MAPKLLKTIKFRIKDKNKAKHLDLIARDVNLVWNVLNSASRKIWKESRKVFHKFDPWVASIVNGASKELLINAQTIQAIRDQIHKDIRQSKKQLRYRGRNSPRWIPFNGQTIKLLGDCVFYNGKKYRIWNSFDVPGKIKSGTFTQDRAGKWFVSLTYEAEPHQSEGINQVGIDLGLKTTATCSDGRELNLKDLDNLDKRIARLQRAKRKKLVTALHKKKANIRKDRINKFARDLVKTNNLIAIGNVQGFTKGRLAKSRYQNSWSILKGQLKFKCLEYGVTFEEVDENFTTQACSQCGSIEGPRGLEGLRVREWTCGCGACLNRDINAALNIRNRAKCLAS